MEVSSIHTPSPCHKGEEMKQIKLKISNAGYKKLKQHLLTKEIKNMAGIERVILICILDAIKDKEKEFIILSKENDET